MALTRRRSREARRDLVRDKRTADRSRSWSWWGRGWLTGAGAAAFDADEVSGRGHSPRQCRSGEAGSPGRPGWYHL